jgi:hypothetical protein
VPKGGFPIGTERTWGGERVRKVAPGKWDAIAQTSLFDLPAQPEPEPKETAPVPPAILPAKRKSDEAYADLSVDGYALAGSPSAYDMLGSGEFSSPVCKRCGAAIKHVYLTNHGPMGGDCVATLTGDQSTRAFARKLLDSLQKMRVYRGDEPPERFEVKKGWGADEWSLLAVPRDHSKSPWVIASVEGKHLPMAVGVLEGEAAKAGDGVQLVLDQQAELRMKQRIDPVQRKKEGDEKKEKERAAQAQKLQGFLEATIRDLERLKAKDLPASELYQLISAQRQLDALPAKIREEGGQISEYWQKRIDALQKPIPATVAEWPAPTLAVEPKNKKLRQFAAAPAGFRARLDNGAPGRIYKKNEDGGWVVETHPEVQISGVDPADLAAAKVRPGWIAKQDEYDQRAGGRWFFKHEGSIFGVTLWQNGLATLATKSLDGEYNDARNPAKSTKLRDVILEAERRDLYLRTKKG